MRPDTFNRETNDATRYRKGGDEDCLWEAMDYLELTISRLNKIRERWAVELKLERDDKRKGD